MKKFILLILLLLPMIAEAQEKVNFVLMPNGTYQTEDGKDFVVISFEGKTAHEIYQELAMNVASTYNDPSEVMSGIDDSMIKIRAYSKCIVSYMSLAGSQTCSGYYQLEFKIRDGRVRVSAPYIEETVIHTAPFGGDSNTEYRFQSLTKKYFDKNGELKQNRKEDYDAVVAKMNDVINRILYSSSIQDADEDW